MRSRGHCKRGGIKVYSEFSISCLDDFSGAPNRFTTVFGYINRGMDVCEEICRLDPTRHEVYIESCGGWPIAHKQKSN
jgi:cyclophilin family peptidyl-prolyl cis-trans isomerase